MGIGCKLVEWFVYYILCVNKLEVMVFVDVICNVWENVSYCSECYSFVEGGWCGICEDLCCDCLLFCVVE